MWRIWKKRFPRLLEMADQGFPAKNNSCGFYHDNTGDRMEMFKKFVLQGNRPHIRIEEELLAIEKSAADAAFKKYNKEMIGGYLTKQGFLKWKTNAYVRRSPIDLLQYIDLQKERYGSKTFTVNCAIMPLYVPAKHMIIGFGDRLGYFIAGKDIWWDYADDKTANLSFQNVLQAVDWFVMPWFEKYDDESAYRKQLKKDSKKSFCGYDAGLWLKAIDGRSHQKQVIYENIQRLKLPKSLMG